eukprot:jgi/Chlat1/3596/Chrsp234S03581
MADDDKLKVDPAEHSARSTDAEAENMDTVSGPVRVRLPDVEKDEDSDDEDEGDEQEEEEDDDEVDDEDMVLEVIYQRSCAAVGVSDSEGGEDDDEDDDDDISYEEDDEEEEATDDDGTEDDNGEGIGVLNLLNGADRPPPLPATPEPMSHPLAHEILLGVASSRTARGLASSMVNVHHMLQNRESAGAFSVAQKRHAAQRYFPTTGPYEVDSMNSRGYIGQFSADGSLFVGGFQDRRIRLYDVYNSWKLRKDIVARNLRWTVTDTAISPDQRFLVFSSIMPSVYMVNIGDNNSDGSVTNITDSHEQLRFDSGGHFSRHNFGLWSLQFSRDGREIVAGSSDHAIYVYDIERNKPILRVVAHEDDVNAVAFADERSSLLYSGSDDRLIKVWDRRCLERSGKPAGVLPGHIEGITFIDSKGDSRYLISNAKDQTIKLWDIRKMLSSDAFDKLPPSRGVLLKWDYRWMDYPATGLDLRHDHDQSIMTYRGHKVLQTLIRCYFSPAYTTGQRYIYSGSHDGSVYIYDVITGLIVKKLEFHRAAVRDCSWHPTLPLMACISWDGMLMRWEHRREGSSHARSPVRRPGPDVYGRGWTAEDTDEDDEDDQDDDEERED